ncbi:MAG: hypothetical protein ACE5PO_03455 [Candidatus Bathyarchaeia archaeon]
MNRALEKLVTAGSILLIASAATIAFFVGAALMERYTQIDLYVGSVWVFVISLIIAAPLIIPLLRKRSTVYDGKH